MYWNLDAPTHVLLLDWNLILFLPKIKIHDCVNSDLPEVNGWFQILTFHSLQLVRENGAAYKLKPSDQFSCLITHHPSVTLVDHMVKPAQSLVGQSQVRVTFTAENPGKYRVVLCVNGREAGGGPSHRTFIPGIDNIFDIQ